jgi:hypothetical protein
MPAAACSNIRVNYCQFGKGEINMEPTPVIRATPLIDVKAIFSLGKLRSGKKL